MGIGFTGTSYRFPTLAVGEQLITRLKQLWDEGEREFHHGDCIHMDEWAALRAREIGFTLICHPPLNDWKRAFVTSHLTLPPKPYLARNKDIVKCSRLLLACPNTQAEELRSGTWMTIRWARKMNVPVEIFV
jgi:hypothetical protein